MQITLGARGCLERKAAAHGQTPVDEYSSNWNQDLRALPQARHFALVGVDVVLDDSVSLRWNGMRPPKSTPDPHIWQKWNNRQNSQPRTSLSA